MTPEWINQQLAFLNAKVGLYQVSAGSDFLFDPTPGFYGFICQGTIPVLNDAIRLLADHILAPSSPTIDPWEGPSNPLATADHDWTQQDGPPGMIRYDGPRRSRIQIAITNKHSPHILGAILAHELTHHYLMNRGIGYPDESENERLTDIATVFLDLGKLTLNGYNPIQWSVPRRDNTVTYTYQVGYLSSRQIADAMCRICSFRSIPLPSIEANLTLEAITHLRVAQAEAKRYDSQKQQTELRRLTWERRKEKLRRLLHLPAPKPKTKARSAAPPSQATNSQKETPTRIIACLKCGQPLRVPKNESVLLVTCPTCKKVFELRTKAHRG